MLDSYLADCSKIELALEKIADCRNDLRWYAGILAQIEDAAHMPARRLADGDKGLFGAVFPNQLRQVGYRAQNGDSVDHSAAVVRIVIQETNGLNAEFWMARDLFCHFRSGPSRTDQEGSNLDSSACAAFLAVQPFEAQPHGDSQ